MSKNMSIIRREIWTLDEDFELQEDYPSSWDKEKFKNLTSFATRKRYADENLQKLGSGSSRHVYLIDREKVLKLAANQKGLSQNYDEQSISNVGWHDDIVSKVFDSHPDDFWIESELAYKTKPTRFRKLTGFSIEDVGKFLKQYNEERNGRRVQYGKISDELYDEMMNSEFIGDILSVIDNWDIYDLDKISSYGEVNRNGKPQIVLIDYGLTQQTFSSHYVRESNKFPSLYDKMEKVGIDQKMINEIMKPIIDQGDLEMGVTDKQEEPPHRGGYNGFALQPDSISQGGLNSDINESESIDKFSNVTKDIIEKAIRNIKSFDSTKMIDIYKDTDLKNIYNSYMITIRNLENVLSNSNSDVNFYEKILTVQDFLKKTNIVNENLEYSHVTNASPENDNYQISEYEQVIHNEFKDETIHQIANDATAKLGYNSKPIYIGQGDNGFAYDLGDGKVLKITGSEAEAAESLSLKGKDSKHLAKIFNVFTINKEDTQLYAIHQEKIDTTRSNEMKQYINELNILFSKKFNKGISKILMAYYTDPNLYNMAYADNIERSIESISEGARQFYYGIIGVMNEVKEAKLDTVDFFLPSNLGYKNGNLAFFDFGGRYDKSFGKKKPKQLNIGENLQQMEKDYIKTGLFTDLDKDINAGGINELGGSSKFMTQNGSRDEDFQDDENSIADFIMERITSYMPKSKEVKVKKKCRIGGNDDGTSTACNQGDISNLEVTEINDDNAHRRKDNTTNVAEEKNNYLENIIKEELNNLIIESRVGLSRGDYENVSDEDLKSYVNKIQNYVDMVDSKKYLSDEDFDDIIYYYLVISYNRDRFQSLVDFGETDRLLNFVRGLLKNRGIINEEIFPEKNNCEILEIPSNVVDFLKKFPNDEQLLRSGGLSNDLLDQWAFGFTENLKQIYPDQLKIIWNDDLENVKYEIKHKGLSDIEFAKSVNLSEPIDVDFDKEGFILQDGHHRYYAAKILNKPLNMKLTIKANPITKLSNMDYDQFHRCIWKQSNNNLNEQLNILKESKDKEEIELNNNCNKYFDFTSLDKYVEFDKPLYSIISKFKTAKLVYMSPQEYLKIIAKNFGLSYEETVNSSMVNKETVLKYAEMMKSGSKSPIGFYTKNKSSQEGRHRALAAMELGCDKIPVIEFYEFKNFNEKQKYVENIINNIKNKYGDINFESTDKYFKSIGFKGISNLGYNDFERNI